MKVQSPTPTNGPARVVKFPPRTSETPAHRGRPGRRGWGDSVGEAQDSLAPDERHLADADDFRHRMWANAAALAFTVALTAIGIWLAMSIADMRKTQDCVLMGRRDCAPITTPHS